jgi:PEGA domain
MMEETCVFKKLKHCHVSFTYLLNLVVVILVFCSFIYPCIALANSVSAARKIYNTGDIPGAAKILSPLAQKGPDTVEALKLLGICQFLMGDKVKAEQSFAKALRQRAGTQLNSSDVIDPSINSFYMAVAKKLESGKFADSAPGRDSLPYTSERTGFTGVFITCDPRKATVFAKGIYVGTTDQDIILEPGQQQITISSPGYESLTKTITVQKNQRVKLSVKLVSEEERERHNEKVASLSKEKAKIEFEKKRLADLAKEDQIEREELLKKQQMLQKMKEQDEKDAARQAVEQKRQDAIAAFEQKRREEAAKRAEAKAKIAAQMEEIKNKKEMRANGGVKPPPKALATDDFDDTDKQNTQRASNSSNDDSKKVKILHTRKSMLIALLPFGAGQFQNNQTPLGLTFLGVGVGGIGGYVYNMLKASEWKTADTKFRNEDPEGASKPEYIAASAAYVKKLSDYKLYSLIFFGIGWGVGATHAVLNMNDSGRVANHENLNQELKPKYSFSPNANLHTQEFGLNFNAEF